MKILKLYEWFAGSMASFVGKFSDNEAKYGQARKFWNKLESDAGWIILLTFIIVGIGAAVFYYLPYNNKPGRRYRPSRWGRCLLITAFIVFFFTLIMECIIAHPKLNGALILECKIAFCNVLYTIALYLIVSVIWCNCFKTNAYRIFKPSKKA